MPWRMLATLEGTLRARDIAVFPVVFTRVGADQRALLAEMEREDFSHMPVRDDNNRVTHVHHRSELRASTDAPARKYDDAMHAIDADDSLGAAITRLATEPFVLVRSREAGTRDNVAGIINHSDLLKAPVRLLVYARSMRLEATVLRLVDAREWEALPALAVEAAAAARMRKGARLGALSLAGYLYLPQLLRVGRALELLQVTDGEIDDIHRARNFAAHAGNELPTDNENAETAAQRIAAALRVLERLLGQLVR